MLVAATETPDDASRTIGSVEMGSRLDLADGHAGNLGGTLGRVLLHAIGNGVEDGLALDRGTVLERDGVGSVELSVHDGVLGGSVVAILVGAPAQGCARLAVPHDEVLVLAALLDIARTQQLVRIGAEEEHSVGPVLQEVLVIELLANDVVHPGKAH